MGEMLDTACELNMEVDFTGDLNIEISHDCPLNHQLITITDACCLNKPPD